MREMKTSSGAVYEFWGKSVRRVSGGDDKRADGDWMKLLNWEEFTLEHSFVGVRLMLKLEQLSDLGPDDSGREMGEVSGGFTTRVTTPVVVDSWHA